MRQLQLKNSQSTELFFLSYCQFLTNIRANFDNFSGQNVKRGVSYYGHESTYMVKNTCFVKLYSDWLIGIV